MCVCLFSALSRRVGALQISIIIIIIIMKWVIAFVFLPGMVSVAPRHCLFAELLLTISRLVAIVFCPVRCHLHPVDAYLPSYYLLSLDLCVTNEMGHSHRFLPGTVSIAPRHRLFAELLLSLDLSTVCYEMGHSHCFLPGTMYYIYCGLFLLVSFMQS